MSKQVVVSGKYQEQKTLFLVETPSHLESFSEEYDDNMLMMLKTKRMDMMMMMITTMRDILTNRHVSTAWLGTFFLLALFEKKIYLIIIIIKNILFNSIQVLNIKRYYVIRID